MGVARGRSSSRPRAGEGEPHPPAAASTWRRPTGTGGAASRAR